jgi:aspartokinase
MIPSAKKLNFLNYQTMWELSKNGAQVLQTRSVELAMNKNVIIQVLSSFLPDNQGTIISIQEDIKQEDFPIIGIASCTTEDGKSCISLVGSNFDKHTAFLEFLMELLKKYNISIWNFKSSFTNIFKNQSLSKICFFVSSCDLLKTLHLLHDKLLKSSYLKFQG